MGSHFIGYYSQLSLHNSLKKVMHLMLMHHNVSNMNFK